MKFEIAPCALALLAAVGTAQAQTKCTTQSGAKAVKKVPTSFIRTISTTTVTRPWSVTAKTTSTVSQSPITISSGEAGNVFFTQTQTLTTTATNGLVTTVDATDFSFVTVKAVTTSFVYTATSTTTLDPSTSTVATPAGFVPAASALANFKASANVQAAGQASADVGAGANAQVKRHIDAHIKANAKAKATPKVKAKKVAKKFPTLVRCTVTKPVSVFVNAGAKPTLTLTTTLPVSRTTVKISGTGTITNTISITITTTVPASTKTRATITRAATNTDFSTVTKSTVSIATSTPPPLGFAYNVCQDANLLDYTLDASGFQVSIDTLDSTIENPTIVRVSNAQACCEECARNAVCDGAYFTRGFCFMLLDSSCAKNASTNAFATFYSEGNNPGKPGSGLTVINGGCGSWKYGGTKATSS